VGYKTVASEEALGKTATLLDAIHNRALRGGVCLLFFRF
jgi:hypothetical protein